MWSLLFSTSLIKMLDISYQLGFQSNVWDEYLLRFFLPSFSIHPQAIFPVLCFSERIRNFSYHQPQIKRGLSWIRCQNKTICSCGSLQTPRPWTSSSFKCVFNVLSAAGSLRPVCHCSFWKTWRLMLASCSACDCLLSTPLFVSILFWYMCRNLKGLCIFETVAVDKTPKNWETIEGGTFSKPCNELGM